jgi:mono/diheme cytochrome c family protein
MFEKLYHFHINGPEGSCMRRVRAVVFSILVAAPLAVVTASFAGAGSDAPAQQKSTSGWTLPPDAADTKSPLAVDDKVLAVGKQVFTDKCQKCHGPKGLGDGPDADPDHAEEMNLTNGKRADRNPDGVVFYKVMNGRRSPKMPPFKDELSKEQIWSVVAYAQSLRKK